MSYSAPALDSSSTAMQSHSAAVLLRTVVIGLTAFLTVVDLFATQPILPSSRGPIM
jgi:MFS transporter, YNFM family, putative membrane transport protein